MEEMEPVTERMCKYQDCYWIIPCLFKYKEVVEKMETRPDDVFVCSFPKSGTTCDTGDHLANPDNFEHTTELRAIRRGRLGSNGWKYGVKGNARSTLHQPDSLPEGKQRGLDHEGHVRRIGRFLGRELTDEQVEGIVAHTTFDFMKKNDAVSYKRYTENADFTFINKGQCYVLGSVLRARGQCYVLDSYKRYTENTNTSFINKGQCYVLG
ncbi:PREDICTED: sulfotransferase family cytosolic 2B member 1-like [Priapulus caudatus]|uniref:Sulfotransferase family cytosolic 2B member 1-like n=1 Tax=Priapulus caudatus TaxID=37621 RepID=A0ABM1F0V4_PRICU|nr:PREDICTED: sulfotransferase family cytosolic 2B member 1-like [Priapulus caudatus]